MNEIEIIQEYIDRMVAIYKANGNSVEGLPLKDLAFFRKSLIYYRNWVEQNLSIFQEQLNYILPFYDAFYNLDCDEYEDIDLDEVISNAKMN